MSMFEPLPYTARHSGRPRGPGIDHSGRKIMRNLMAHAGQPDEDTIAFFDEGGYVRVPGEVLVERYAMIPHRGTLTHHILVEPDGDRSHV